MRLILVLIALPLLPVPAAAALIRDPASEMLVYNADGTTILRGCAFSLKSDGTSTGPAKNAVHVSAADVRPDGVMQADCPAASYCLGDQVGAGNTQLRLSATVANAGLGMSVANAVGEWGPAATSSANALYVSSGPGTAATNTMWAMPMASYPMSQAGAYVQSVEGRTTTDFTSPSNTFVAVTGCSATITTSASTKVKVTATIASGNASALGSRNVFALYVDGVASTGTAQNTPLISTYGLSGAITRLLTGLAAGAHTIAIYGKTTAGTMQVLATTTPQEFHCVVVAEEVRQ